MGRDQQIVAPDGSARLLQFGTDSSIVLICFQIKGKNLNSIE